MKRTTQKLTVEEAFKRWIGGESFTAVKKRVGKPLMKAFEQLGGGTWKQLTAKRAKAARKENKS